MIDRYSTKLSKKIWSDKNKYLTWLKVEIAVCDVLCKKGILPKEVKELFKNNPTFSKEEVNQILDIESECKHDVIAFLTFLEKFYGKNSSYIHSGLTSSDIVDTSTSLLYREMLNGIKTEFATICNVLQSLVQQHKKTLMIGRTHGMHAQPITFGIMIAGHLEQFRRVLETLETAIETISYGKLSGAVGTNVNIDQETEQDILRILNLKPEKFATQIIPRDRHATCMFALSLAAAAIERLALNIRHLQKEEIGEVQEPFAEKQKGSSAMPHKKNPILCENLCGLSRYVRSNLNASMENISLWHERDMSHSSTERIIIPDTTSVVHFMAERMLFILRGLKINKIKMLSNLSASGDIIFSENILLKLVGAGLSRKDAYTLVQSAAHKNDVLSFKANILADTEIQKFLTKEKLEDCFDIGKITSNLEKKFNEN